MIQQLIQSGGVQIVTTPKRQLIYLDFDGETTSYNGEVLTIDEVIINDSGLSQTQINSIISQLNTQYAGHNVVFITERPTSGDYSTVFIGKTSAFDYTGLAETVDKGNLNQNDNAFVNLDASSSLDKIINVISHEVDHLLGTLDHGGEGLAQYAYSYVISSGVTSTGVKVSAGDEMTILNGGAVNSTIINSGGVQYVSSGGTAINTVIKWGGSQHITSGGSADLTTGSGWLYVYSGGIANNTSLDGGRLSIYFGGVVNNVTCSEAYINVFGELNNVYWHQRGGTINISSGGVVNNIIVSRLIPGIMDMNISSGGVANNLTWHKGALVNYEYDRITVLAGGVVNSATLAQAELHTYGVTNNIILSAYAKSMQIVWNGGVANNTIIEAIAKINHYEIGGQLILSGGVANSTFISSGGKQSIGNGGIASNTVISSGGSLFLSSGGSAINLDWTPFVGYFHNDGGYVTFANTLSGCYYGSGGTMYSSAASMSSLTLSNASMYVMEGGSTNNMFINSGSHQYVSNKGKADNTVVHSGGILYTYIGAILGGTTILSGTMSVFGTVSAQGAAIEFAMNERKSTDEAIITDISLITGANYSITVNTSQGIGSYALADGAGNFAQSIKLNVGGTELGSLSLNSSALSDGDRNYSLYLNDQTLTLSIIGSSVATTPNTNLSGNGYSQIVAWDAAQGKVGYVATNGQVAPQWTGIWEWSGSEASMWKVVGVGRFSSSVEHDGILLYNGYGNTFAAWTDLGRGDYGYVSLCHVDGNFQTKTLADFDGNGLDDVIIYDEKGSFGIVSDARTYHDVWHVTNASTNVQKLIGAGYFGNADGKSDILVKKTDENAFFLWHNEDPTFNTWNWSQTYLGTLDNDWEVAAIGDFQGDGIDDIIMWQKSTGYMYAWEDGKSSNQRWVGQLNASQWEVAAVGDYNGDGKEDLLLRELSTGWGGVGYWASGNASNWTDLNARIETDMESKFAIIA